MRIINVYGLQLQFDDNGSSPEAQARDLVNTINGVLATRNDLSEAQIFWHRDEVEIEPTENDA